MHKPRFITGLGGESLRELARRDSGASAVEYALMVAFIAIVIVLAVTVLGLNVAGAFQSAVDQWP